MRKTYIPNLVLTLECLRAGVRLDIREQNRLVYTVADDQFAILAANDDRFAIRGKAPTLNTTPTSCEGFQETARLDIP